MSRRVPSTPDRLEGGRYEIRLKGHLDARWAAWFDGLRLRRESDGTTVVSGPIADQAALHGLLQKVRDAGLPLVSIARIEPDSRIAPHRRRTPINPPTGDPHDR